MRVGPGRAKELLYSGRLVTAEEAAILGLVSTVVDDNDLEAELRALLGTWRSQPTAALRSGKAAVNARLAPITGAAVGVPASKSVDSQEFPRRVEAFLHRSR